MKTTAQSPAVSNANIPTTRCNIGHNITHNGWMESCFHLWNCCRQSIVQKNIAEVKSCSTPSSLGLNQVTNLVPGAFSLGSSPNQGKGHFTDWKKRWKMLRKLSHETSYRKQTVETVFDHISKQREESWKYDAWRSNFEELWIFLEYNQTVGQTLSRVFDTSTQWKLKLS